MYEPPSKQEETFEKFVADAALALGKDAALNQYLHDRGFTDATIWNHRLGVCPKRRATPEDIEFGLAYPGGKWVLADRLIIPYSQDGIVVTVRGRQLPGHETDKKYMSLPGTTTPPYIPERIDPEKPVLLCEGEFDALLASQFGFQAIGIPGAQHFEKDKDLIAHYPSVYVAFDGDDAGRKGMDKVIKSLVEARRVDLPEGFDVGDYLSQFGAVSFQTLLDKAELYLHGKHQKEDRFSVVVEKYSDWSWTNGKLLGPALSWAPRMEKALSGWSPGLILIGAEAHSGKSCFLVKSLYEVAIENPDDTVALYLSLDDTIEEAMTRILSLHADVEFSLVRQPRHAPADVQKKIQKAVNTLKNIDNLILRDATYGRSLNYLSTLFEKLRKRYPEKRLVVFIDSLAKIIPDVHTETESGPKSNWKAYLASELKYLSTKYSLCIVTPTDLRKINGFRRPTRDDLKDAAELAYEANVILLGYNDLKKNRDNAVITWVGPTGDPEPILEFNIDKNKITGITGNIRYRMLGATSNFQEVSWTEDQQYDIVMRDQIANQPKGSWRTP